MAIGTHQGVAGLAPRPFTLEEETGSHHVFLVFMLFMFIRQDGAPDHFIFSPAPRQDDRNAEDRVAPRSACLRLVPAAAAASRLEAQRAAIGIPSNE